MYQMTLREHTKWWIVSKLKRQFKTKWSKKELKKKKHLWYLKEIILWLIWSVFIRFLCPLVFLKFTITYLFEGWGNSATALHSTAHKVLFITCWTQMHPKAYRRKPIWHLNKKSPVKNKQLNTTTQAFYITNLFLSKERHDVEEWFDILGNMLVCFLGFSERGTWKCFLGTFYFSIYFSILKIGGLWALLHFSWQKTEQPIHFFSCSTVFWLSNWLHT